MDLCIDFEGRTVVITGAAGGLGLVLVKGFASNGAKVLAADINESVSGLTEAGSILGVKTDVSDKDQVKNMVDVCVREFGPPDILVNVAAISTPRLVKDMDIDNWRLNLDVNLTSVFLCTTAVLPYMMERGAGSIISFSSVVAELGGKSSAHYAAAKGGIEAFSRSLAREVGPKGVRVNVVAPGMIDTEMLSLMSDDQKAALARRLPLPRIGRPEEIVGPVLFLASDAASYITGQTLSVNGGMAMS